MLPVSFMLIISIWLVLSRYDRIELGKNDDEPEFSTASWLTMLFAAGTRINLSCPRLQNGISTADLLGLSNAQR